MLLQCCFTSCPKLFSFDSNWTKHCPSSVFISVPFMLNRYTTNRRGVLTVCASAWGHFRDIAPHYIPPQPPHTGSIVQTLLIIGLWSILFTASLLSLRGLVVLNNGGGDVRPAWAVLRAPDASEHEQRLPLHPKLQQEPGSVHMEGVSFPASECFIF